MAWKIHLSAPSPDHALESIDAKAKELIPGLTEPEALQVRAAVEMAKGVLKAIPTSHQVMGWMEARVGPRYTASEEILTHFGCHLSSREREG